MQNSRMQNRNTLAKLLRHPLNMTFKRLALHILDWSLLLLVYPSSCFSPYCCSCCCWDNYQKLQYQREGERERAMASRLAGGIGSREENVFDIFRKGKKVVREDRKWGPKTAWDFWGRFLVGFSCICIRNHTVKMTGDRLGRRG